MWDPTYWMDGRLWLNLAVFLGATLVFHLLLRSLIGLIRRRLDAFPEGRSRWPLLSPVRLISTSKPRRRSA